MSYLYVSVSRRFSVDGHKEQNFLRASSVVTSLCINSVFSKLLCAVYFTMFRTKLLVAYNDDALLNSSVSSIHFFNLLEVETFLHDLSMIELPDHYSIRRQKLESKVKLLRTKYHLNLHRVPLASLRLAYDPFPKDLEVKRPRSLTSPDTMANYLPGVPEEEEAISPGPGNQAGKLDKGVVIRDDNENIIQGLRPRSASFPLTI